MEVDTLISLRDKLYTPPSCFGQKAPLIRGRWGGGTYFEGPSRKDFYMPPSLSNQGVLHGVGADGVGVKFPIFAVIAVVCPCPLGEAEKSEEKGEKCIKKGKSAQQKKGNHSDPIYTNPIKNLPI